MKKRYKTEKDWKTARQQVVTATEASIILGLNPFSKAADLWQDKTENEFQGNSYTYIGQLLEPIVVQVANKLLKTSFSLCEDPKKGKLFYTAENLKLGATPDAMDGDVLLECKTATPKSFLRYMDKPPHNYIIQLQVQMYCTGAKKGYLAIMSTNLAQSSQELSLPMHIFLVKKNNVIFKLLEQEIPRFWKVIEAKEEFQSDPQVTLMAKAACGDCVTKIR